MIEGHPEWGVVRILAARPGTIPVGAGFLVSGHHVLTCAHVVNEALNRDPYTDDQPDTGVFLDLPGGTGLADVHGPPATARVIAWLSPRPQPRQGQPDDIAVLALQTPREAAQALPLLNPALPVLVDCAGYAYGFPDHGDSGLWARGRLSGHQHYGWRQIDDGDGPAIAAGFSGCPFLDATQERVIGMVVARHNRFPVSYLIPVATLLQAWEELARVATLANPPEPDRGVAAGSPCGPGPTTGGGASIGGNQSTGGGDAVGRDQTKIQITNVIAVPGHTLQPQETPLAPDKVRTGTSAPGPVGPPTLVLKVDCMDGLLGVSASRPMPTPVHTTALAGVQQALDANDQDALFRVLFASPHQLAELATAAGAPGTDDPTANPLRLRLVCADAQTALLPWHYLSHDGRRLGESRWIVEVLSEPDGDTFEIALDNPLVVAPSDPTLPISARSHATNVVAHIRRLLADCRAPVPWVRTCRELDAALGNEPDLIYLFAQLDANGGFVLGKEAAHREAYPLDDLIERLQGFRSKPLVWLHLVGGNASAAIPETLWERLLPLTRLLLIQLTTPGKLFASLNSTLEWMAAMADGKQEPAAVLSRLGSQRDTHLWLGGRSLRLSPCSDTDAALLGYIRASLIRLLLGRKPEKRQLGAGIREQPEGHLTLYGVCGDMQACVHDFPEQARRYIEELDRDRHTIVETRPLPLTMRASPNVRVEVATQLVQDLNITGRMPPLEALRRIPVVPPEREDTFIVALSWLLEPAADFSQALLPAWLMEWKQGLLDVLDKEQIPPEFRLLVSACIQWPDGWPERRGGDSQVLQQEIDRVLDQGNPRDYVHCIEMQRPLSVLRAADLREFYGDQTLRRRLHAQDQSIEPLVDYILERTGGRFQDTVDRVYSEYKHRYAGFRDSLKGPEK